MPIDKSDVARFLHYIKEIESSGGQNTNHPVIESGIHAGDQAQGDYGMMPNTMDELKRRYPALAKQTDPDLLAPKLAEQVLNKADKDETLAAALWNQGHNTSEDKFDKIKQSKYAQKYESMRKQIPEAIDPNPYYDQEPDTFKLLKNVMKGK